MKKTTVEAVKQDLIEHFNRGEFLEGARVDRKANTIIDVKLCGKHSKNGREYSDRALTDATRLYEGCPFYLDHPTDRELRDRKGIRSVLDLAGKIANVRKVGDAVRGDIHLLDKDPSRALVLAIADQMPTLAGNSHRASGTVRRGDNGVDVVESLDAVAGVELVTDPATASGLFESVTKDDDDMKDLTLDKLKADRPDLVESILAASTKATELEALKLEKKDLEKKLDEATARDKSRDHKTMVAERLAKAKLPKRIVTEFFTKQLEDADDEKAVDALIADRADLGTGTRSTGATSTEREVKEGTGGDEKPLKEADMSKSGLRLVNV